MQKIVIDTSVFVDHSRSGKGLYASLIEKGKSGSLLYTPSIVILELFAGRSALKEREKIRRLLEPIKQVDLTRQLAEVAGKLIRDNQINETEDSIVAATALYLGAELATSNRKHFVKVKSLKLFNP